MTDSLVWVNNLVRAAVPDEADLAAAIVQAFIRGGEIREQMFLKSGCSGTSAFDPIGTLLVTPWLLKALVAAGSHLDKILFYLGGVTGIVLNIRALMDMVSDLQKKENPEGPTQGIPASVCEDLKKTVSAFSTALESAGLPQDQRDAIAYRAIRALLEDPQNARNFVGRLQVP